MPETQRKILFNVPEPTLRRLPWYLAFAKLVQKDGGCYLSSTRIARNIALTPSVVAKDLSYVDVVGRTRVGYQVDELVCVLERFLGFTHSHKAFLFGVGSLGGALLHDDGLKHFGLEIVAGFDAKSELIGKSINHIPVYPPNRFLEMREQTGVDIGVLTVSVESAQAVCDFMVSGGIKAVWNFTPYRIRVPENVVVQNTSIYAHLAVMFNRLHAISDIEQARFLEKVG